MLLVLRSQIEEVETVAAACHILYSITHDDAIRGPPRVDIKDQLSHGIVADGIVGDDSLLAMPSKCTARSSPAHIAAGALVLVLQWHAQRRDVTRKSRRRALWKQSLFACWC